MEAVRVYPDGLDGSVWFDGPADARGVAGARGALLRTPPISRWVAEDSIWKYALGDFAVRQAGRAFGAPAADIAKYENRSMNFVNHWDANVTHDGFTGFMQRRYPVSILV